eukprot:6492535-Amphidinium_carterae.3
MATILNCWKNSGNASWNNMPMMAALEADILDEHANDDHNVMWGRCQRLERVDERTSTPPMTAH